MRIVASVDKSREGNDCFINESISILEEFGIYSVIVCCKVTGWDDREIMYTAETSSDYEKIKAKYKELRGKF